MGQKIENDFASPLLELANALCIPTELLESCETHCQLLLRDEQLSAEKALAVPLEVWRGLNQRYGEALKLQLLLGDLPVLTVDDDISERRLEEFRRLAGDIPELCLDLSISKELLAAPFSRGRAHEVTKVFIFPSALARTLKIPLEELEKTLFSELSSGDRIAILVPDHEIHLDGEYITTVGGLAIDEWKLDADSKPADFELTKNVYNEALKSLRWVFFSLETLTPHHLMISGECTPGDQIAEALEMLSIRLSLIYTAGRSVLEENGMRFTYAAGSNVAELSVDNAAPARRPSCELGESAHTLQKIALWAYSGDRGSSDRLSTVQAVLARSLSGSSPESNYLELLSRTGHIFQEIEFGWASFIAGKLDVYFSRVRDMEQAVDAALKSFDESIQSLTKSLTDSALAAAAVIVGSFIAAIFKNEFNANVFRLGVFVYTAYLLIFPCTIGLYSIWQRFALALSAFDKKKSDFGLWLLPEKVETITGTIVKSRVGWFKRWFVFTLCAFLMIAVLMIVGAIYIPRIIQ